jgi:UDP-N-acetylmuramyl pentapeptide phosphotransferase/UDP-N-acetylglucosamine-1-phosphate transferase
MQWSFSLIVVGCVFVATFVLTGVVLRFLRTHAIFDYPNQRSSHSIPTPKGAGIAVIGCICVAWIIISWSTPMAGVSLAVVFAALALAAVSWFDDLKGLSPLWRFLAQITAVAFVIMLAWSPPKSEIIIFGGLVHIIWGKIALCLVWVWFINLFNFMDGIDGITGVETATIGIGVAVVVAIAGLAPFLGLLGIAVTASALGFLWWNWHPAKIFLGDVGSVPLGFLLGWLLLQLAVNGQWVPATILPLYYFADATITLVRRGLRIEKVWQAHHEHFYQRATANGLNHGEVVQYILLADIALVALAAAAALGWGVFALISALIVVVWLLFFLGAKASHGHGKT